MREDKKLNLQTLLGDYFGDNFPMEQVRYKMFLEHARYYKILELVFRFSKNKSEMLNKQLETSLELFHGNLKWVIFPGFYCRGVINYSLVPEELYLMYKDLYERDVQISQMEYFGEKYYKKLCEQAIEDIEPLYNHLKKTFVYNEK